MGIQRGIVVIAPLYVMNADNQGILGGIVQCDRRVSRETVPQGDVAPETQVVVVAGIQTWVITGLPQFLVGFVGAPIYLKIVGNSMIR